MSMRIFKERKTPRMGEHCWSADPSRQGREGFSAQAGGLATRGTDSSSGRAGEKAEMRGDSGELSFDYFHFSLKQETRSSAVREGGQEGGGLARERV